MLINALLLLLVLSAAPEVHLTSGPNIREVRFTDKAGAHLVRFELPPERLTKREGLPVRSRELKVVHLVGKKELWRAKDFVNDCEFDLELNLFEESISVTDLDDDGEAEISFIYQLGCRSDVSPLTAKLLLYEGSTKYALRGDSRVRVSETDFIGGDFTQDVAFEKAPKPFVTFAKAQWARIVSDAK